VSVIRRRLFPSPSLLVAFVALLVALGGTSYAVVRLPARSVGAKQLKPSAVTGAKVADDSLTGADIREATLAKVPAAVNADNVANAGHAGAAAALDKVVYKTTSGSVAAAPNPTTASMSKASAFCDSGQHAVGGGARLDDPDSTAVHDSYPDAGGTVWTVDVANDDDAAAHGYTVYAICVTSGS